MKDADRQPSCLPVPGDRVVLKYDDTAENQAIIGVEVVVQTESNGISPYWAEVVNLPSGAVYTVCLADVDDAPSTSGLSK